MTPWAVLDTSVLVPARTRTEFQRYAAAGVVAAVWSPWIVAELNRVLTWQWIVRSGRDTSRANWRVCSASAATMMELLLGSFETVDPGPPFLEPWPGLVDAGDRRIWAAAVAAEAAFVVSDNWRHFPPVDRVGRSRWDSIEYVTADEFLRRLGAGEFRDIDSDRERGARR